MAEHAGLLAVVPHTGLPGYSALGTAVLLAAAGSLAAWLVRRRAAAGHRLAPAWDCGFDPPPTWLPFGDPLTQYGGASFSQPVRRALGAVLDVPERGLNRPLAAAGRRLAERAGRLPPLTVRHGLALAFAALVLFLLVVAVVEQSG
jgi:hypothetical protein